MKTLYVSLLALAMLSAPAFAGTSEHTVSVHTGGDKLVVTRACFPATGNWVNATSYSCPDQGSGGLGSTDTIKVECEHEPKAK